MSDLAGSNVGLHKKLKVEMDNPFIYKPVDPARKIHFFAGVPHLLKLVKNSLLDHGIQYKGQVINTDSLYELFNPKKGDFRMAIS